MSKITWPAWFSGPDGKSAIFESAGDVPAGWTTGAEKLTVSGEKAAETPKPAKTPEPDKIPTTNADKAPAGEKVELDTGGWPWSAELHASSKSKTKDGYWRMKVGVSRPSPKSGYPLDL